MLILCIADVERDVGMKNLSRKEAITILESMRVDIPVPKAAVTQNKRNAALDMAINALNCSETPNNSDTIYRQQAIDVLEERLQNSGYSNVALVSELNRSIGYLMRLPSAQPERKKQVFKTYEQEQKEIKVGDELDRILNGEVDSKAVFLEEDEGYYRCLFWTGACFTTLAYPKKQFRKTGRHFHEIATVLEKMRGEQE